MICDRSGDMSQGEQDRTGANSERYLRGAFWGTEGLDDCDCHSQPWSSMPFTVERDFHLSPSVLCSCPCIECALLPPIYMHDVHVRLTCLILVTLALVLETIRPHP